MNILEVLKKHNLSISTAESITTGLISTCICMQSGASKYFKGGVVAYTKETKCSLLGLNMIDIEKYGVYSNETATAMAKGIRKKTGSDIAIATSGVAGPGSDEGVEAGTVYFCFIIKGKIYNECISFQGERNEVKMRAGNYAIDRVVKLIEENNS